MGYSVGFDYSQGRWIGYGVPAECDWPDCHEKIDHGMAYKCEEHEPDTEYDVELDDAGRVISIKEASSYDPENFDTEGCGLFFCSEHQYRTDEHDNIQPKPDIPAWEHHMLRDESWARWREEEGARQIPGMLERTKDYVCDEDCEHG